MKHGLEALTLSFLVMTTGVGFAAVAAPALSPSDGNSSVKFTVKVDCATPGARIRYTLNGAEPTLFDFSIPSGGSIPLARNLTVKAKAWTDTESSATTSASYAITGDIATGGIHSLGLSSAIGLNAWGGQDFGKLGNGQTNTANIAVPLQSLYPAALSINDAWSFAAGKEHSVFLRNDRTVWAFGRNSFGQLGDTSNVDQPNAVQVRKSATPTDMLTDCVAVGAGANFSAAVSSSGAVYTWGLNVASRLGDGTTPTTRKYAGKVQRGDIGSFPDLGGINRVALSITSLASQGSTLAKEPSAREQAGGAGKVWAWGTNSSGQLGQGNTTGLTRAWPVKLDASNLLTDAWDIAIGSAHSVVVRWKDGDSALQGSVWCFGAQANGCLGNNLLSAASVTYPVTVVKSGGAALAGIVAVSAGTAHTLALDENRNVWAWGANTKGSLGDNSTAAKGYAVKVKDPSGTGDLANIVKIAAGGDSSLALDADGKVYGWGNNTYAQLGKTASSTSTLLPVQIASFDLTPSPPEVTLACTVTANSYPAGTTLTASPTDSDSGISRVDFYCQGNFVGQISSAPWVMTLSNLGEGSYHAFAVVTDSTGLPGYSAPVDFTISYGSALASLDMDGDGWTGAQETAAGTSPDDADTDGDGIPDSVDPDPTHPATIPTDALTSSIMVWNPAE